MDAVYKSLDTKDFGYVTLHGHTDNFVYTDAAHKEKIDADTLFDLCARGLAVIELTNVFYRPVAFKKNAAVTEVTIDASTSATYAQKVLKSA